MSPVLPAFLGPALLLCAGLLFCVLLNLTMADSGLASSDFLPCLRLYRTDQEIQTYTIAVINALFLKAPDERRQVGVSSLVLRL